MDRYDVEFTLKNGEKIKTIMGQKHRSTLLANIKYRLSTLKYWDVQLEKGTTVLVTDEVTSFSVSDALEKDESSFESNSYTFPALLFKDLNDQNNIRGYTIVFPDLDLFSDGETLLDSYHSGKRLLKDHLEMELEERSNEVINNPYFYHPSKSQEEALERHYENFPEAFDDEELREKVIFHKFTEITVSVDVDRDYKKYYLDDWIDIFLR